MKIQVTKEDIKKGEQGSCEWCPVALAIQRTYDLKNGKDKMVVVDGDCVGIWDKNNGEQQYQLPQYDMWGNLIDPNLHTRQP